MMNKCKIKWIRLFLVVVSVFWTNVYCYEYLGCFKGAVLPSNKAAERNLQNQEMTIPFCITFCKAQNCTYAGLRGGWNCVCDNGLYANLSCNQTNETECDYLCTGNRSTFCGGSFRVSLYRIDLNVTADEVLTQGEQNTSTTSLVAKFWDITYHSSYQCSLSETTEYNSVSEGNTTEATTLSMTFFDTENTESSSGTFGHSSESDRTTNLQPATNTIWKQRFSLANVDTTITESLHVSKYKDISIETTTLHSATTTATSSREKTSILSTDAVALETNKAKETTKPPLSITIHDEFTYIENKLCQSCLCVDISSTEFQSKLNRVIQTVAIDKKQTSLYKRLKISVDDPRTSSAIFGVVGIVFISLVILLFIMSDIQTCWNNQRKYKHRHKSRRHV